MRIEEIRVRKAGIQSSIRNAVISFSEMTLSVVRIRFDHGGKTNEAITFSERMLLMNGGMLIQNGNPSEIYRYPKTLWAARFVGEANLLGVNHTDGDNRTPLGILNFAKGSTGNAVTVMIRPEELHLLPPDKDMTGGSIVSIEFAGPVQNLTVRLDSGEELRVSTSPKRIWTEGESVSVVPEHFQCYDASGQRLDDEASLKPVSDSSS